MNYFTLFSSFDSLAYNNITRFTRFKYKKQLLERDMTLTFPPHDLMMAERLSMEGWICLVKQKL